MTIKTTSHWVVTGLVMGMAALPVLAQGTGTTGTGGAGATGTTGAGGGAMGGGATGHAAGAAQLDTALRTSFDSVFMLKAAQGNMAEIATSQLALRRARNDQARQIAQHMVQQHSAANTELLAIMARKGVPIPRSVGVMHMATQEQLNRASRNAFDALYMGAQMEEHENAITLYQQEIAMGQDPDVRAYAERYLPAIMSHAAMIYGVARAVGAPGVAERPALLTSGGALPQAGMTTMGLNGTTGTTGNTGRTTGTGTTMGGAGNTTGGTAGMGAGAGTGTGGMGAGGGTGTGNAGTGGGTGTGAGTAGAGSGTSIDSGNNR